MNVTIISDFRAQKNVCAKTQQTASLKQHSNQSINQYSFNKSCQTQLKTAKILAMHTQYKIMKKIESYKVFWSITFFVQHTYKKSLCHSVASS